MLRAIVGVVVGYIAMAVFIFATFSIAYLTMGTDGAFRANSFDPSTLWVVTSFILGFIGAIVGGFVCAMIAKASRAPIVLAGLVLVLGLLIAIPVLTASDAPKVRTGDIGNIEAMQNARQPAWVALLNPLVGAAGVIVGARLKRSSGRAAA